MDFATVIAVQSAFPNAHGAKSSDEVLTRD